MMARGYPVARFDPSSSNEYMQEASTSRQERLRKALFRGEQLSLSNPPYLRTVRVLLEELQRADLDPADLTVESLRLDRKPGGAEIIAKESGVAAGLAEAAWFYIQRGLDAELQKADGDLVEPGEILLWVRGDCRDLLSSERVGLNLLQRLSGIATATRRLQESVHRLSAKTHVVATRKTPWGLLDKRAVHLGGGGTHRLGLGDAILIKSNHLFLFGVCEARGINAALELAWKSRQLAAFIEVEVTIQEEALEAARVFHRLQDVDSEWFPCLLLLDNMPPEEVRGIVDSLRAQGLYDDILIEVSGRISESVAESYAACEVDAISVGALTHSCRALDLHTRLRPRMDERR
jgi:nicotinate-nucleotide pyrophosphorylase (carboxylating)